MSEQQKKEHLENFEEKLEQMSENDKQFVLGYMEGVCQATERYRQNNEKSKS